jgi:CO dehydrogenase nickel-insertion accessory protein CooC1
MASKGSTNNNEAGTTTRPTIHLILQGKGGIGKTVVATWLAEFLIGRGQPVCCVDGDPVNPLRANMSETLLVP